MGLSDLAATSFLSPRGIAVYTAVFHSWHSMIKCEFCGLKTTDVGRSLARCWDARTHHTIAHAHARCLSIPTDSECDCDLIL